MRWPFVCQNDLWQKLKVEFAKVNYFLRKFRESRKIWLEHTWIFEDEINSSIYVGRFSQKFGESFDKAWRKTAFSWKLGGLTVDLLCLVSRGTGGRWALSFGVEVSELAGEGEQGPTPHVNVQPPQNEFWWLLRRSDVPCQALVPYQKFPTYNPT